MLRNGRDDPKDLAAIIVANPAARSEIFALLHTTLGNAIVHQVVAEVDASAKAPKTSIDTSIGKFENIPSVPADLVETDAKAVQVPAALISSLGVDASADVKIHVGIIGREFVMAVAAGGQVLLARVDLERVIHLFVGPAASEILDLANKIDELITSPANRLRLVNGTLIRVQLWADNFVVIDPLAALRGAAKGTIAGLRPVEARLASRLGRVEQFAGKQIAMARALPPAEAFVGDLEVMAPALRKDLLGLEDEGPIHGALYYLGGKLAVAVKPDANATTGIVAEIDLAYLVDRLAALGEKLAELLKKLLPKFKGGKRNWFRWRGGSFEIDLGLDFKNFFSFDFNLLLPRLGGGGGFDLSGLWPTTWSIDLPSFSIGALPRLRMPWLAWPKLKSFELPSLHFGGLFGRLGLPSVSLPSIDLDLHFRGLDFGFGLDLGKLWPDLDWGIEGPSWFGFDFDLTALLELLAKAAGAIGKAARWLLAQLKKVGDAIRRWVHFGDDFVLRIFDADADVSKTPMLGFSLLRLLDGAQATDLTPVEIRYHGDDATMELGQAVAPGADLAQERGKREEGAAVPQRPASPLVDQDNFALPAVVTDAVGVEAGATGYVSVAGEYPHLVAYVEAKSAHRKGNEALRLTLDLERQIGSLLKKLPARKPNGKLLPQIEGIKIGKDAAIAIELGDKAASLDKQNTPYVRGAWKMKKLFEGDLEPDQFDLQASDIAGLTRGPFTEPQGLIGERFGVTAPGIRKDVLDVSDGKADVYLGVYYEDEILALTATAEKDKHEGVLGHINVVTLLDSLKKLGALGERALDAIGDALGAGASKLRGFAAKAAAIAQKIGRAMLGFAKGLLKLALPTGKGGGGFLEWDLSRLIPNLSMSGFSLAGLIPDLRELRFPSLPGFSLSWLPQVPFDGSFLDKISLPSLQLRRLFEGLDLDLPRLPEFSFEVFGIDHGLGISIDLSGLGDAIRDLFGGHHRLSFTIDFDRILAPFARAWEWLKSKFPAGRARKGTDIQIKLGGDGVLRLWDNQAHIGFALTKLLDGFQPADVVPVEMSFQVTSKGNTVASLEYGQVVDGDHPAPKDKEAGQVLAQRPKGRTFAEARFDAPEVVREHLGAPKGADLDVDLIQENATTAAMFAKVIGSDRGLVMHVDTGSLEKLVKTLGPKAPADLKDGNGVQILWDKCRATNSLVIGFGPQPDGKTKRENMQPHGHARWRLSRFFDGLELGDLVPDEAEVETKHGGISVGVGIDVSGLQKVTEDFAVPAEPSWMRSALDSPQAAIFANNSEAALSIAVVAADPKADKDKRAPRRGIELEVAGWFLDQIEAKVAEMARKGGEVVGKVLAKTAGAGARIGGDLNDRRISLERTRAGLRLQRGKDGDPDHLYATFGWTGLVDAVSRGEPEGLVPTEFRIATRTMSLEVEDATPAPGAKMPVEAKRIGAMHPLFKDTLKQFNLSDDQFLELRLGDSPVVELPDGGHDVRLGGMIYTPKSKPPADQDHAPGIEVADANKVTFAISLEALLAQVLPRQRRFANQKKHKKPKDGGTKMSLGYRKDLVPEETGDQMGIGLNVSSSHTSKKTGKTRKIEVEVGWTAEKLIQILMNLDDIVSDDPDAKPVAGLLTPDVMRGSFENHLFKLAVANRGEKVGESIRCGDLPLLPEILSSFVDLETANETIIHLEVPGAGELSKKFGKALLAGDYVQLGRAAIAMPGAAHPVSATLELSLGFLERLAMFIPYVGLAIKIIRGVESFVRDPKGTAEAILYTPEMLYHFVDNAGAIYDKLSSMSVKDIALAYLSNDATTKQAVLAARIKKKLDKAGIKGPDGKQGEMPSAEELEFLGEQSPEALKAAMELHARMEKLGLLPEESGVPPKGTKIKPEELQTKMAAIEAGFTDFANAYEAQQANPNDPAAKQRTAEEAEKFRKNVAAHIKAGATSMPREADRKTDKDLLPGEKPEEVDEKELTRVDELPTPDPDRLAEAQAMFSESKDGLDQTREAYLLQKLAFLSTAQLADLIENDQVTITDKAGQSRVLPLWPSERAFAIALFKHRVDKAGTLFKKANPTATPATDKEMIAAWRLREQKQADANKKAAKKTARAEAKDGAAGKGKGKGKGKAKIDDGAGDGAGGDQESLDEALWGEEPEDEGFGDSGQGRDADGDGKLSKEELEGKTKPQDNRKQGGEAALDEGVKPKDGKKKDKTAGHESFADLLSPLNRVLYWDKDALQMKKQEDALEYLDSQRRYILQDGGKHLAFVSDFDVRNSGNTAAQGQAPKYEFTVVFDIFVDGGNAQKEYHQFYYRPDTNFVGSLETDSEAVMTAVRKSFAVRDGSVVATGVAFQLFRGTYSITDITPVSKNGRQHMFLAVLRLDKLTGDFTLLRNAQGEMQELREGDTIRVRLGIGERPPS
ncbi:MAG: hypothetical protein WKG01_04765 [Kofleriaceae bacterium]